MSRPCSIWLFACLNGKWIQRATKNTHPWRDDLHVFLERKIAHQRPQMTSVHSIIGGLLLSASHFRLTICPRDLHSFQAHSRAHWVFSRILTNSNFIASSLDIPSYLRSLSLALICAVLSACSCMSSLSKFVCSEFSIDRRATSASSLALSDSSSFFIVCASLSSVLSRSDSSNWH